METKDGWWAWFRKSNHLRIQFDTPHKHQQDKEKFDEKVWKIYLYFWREMQNRTEEYDSKDNDGDNDA